MPSYIEKAEQINLPVIPLRGAVAFPAIAINFEISDDMAYGQKFPYDEERAKMIRRFIDQGYIRQIFISCDIDGRTLMKKWGGWGYSHLLTSGLLLLRKEGLSWDQIDQITRINPKEFLRVRK